VCQARLETELDNALQMVKVALSERDLARDVAFRQSEEAMMKHEEHRLLLARQHDLRLQESDVLQMRREVELKVKEVDLKMSQLQFEQGQAQFLHLRLSAEAEARTIDDMRKREEESERERAHQRENVTLHSRLCYVLLALKSCAAATEDALAGVIERFKDVVEQRDLLGKQLRVSLKQIVSMRAQMELERKTLGELSERACIGGAGSPRSYNL
jgi:predicted RNA-binding protein